MILILLIREFETGFLSFLTAYDIFLRISF